MWSQITQARAAADYDSSVVNDEILKNILSNLNFLKDASRRDQKTRQRLSFDWKINNFRCCRKLSTLSRSFLNERKRRIFIKINYFLDSLVNDERLDCEASVSRSITIAFVNSSRGLNKESIHFNHNESTCDDLLHSFIHSWEGSLVLLVKWMNGKIFFFSSLSSRERERGKTSKCHKMSKTTIVGRNQWGERGL